MSKKIAIVGGNAGGASCAARLRRLDEDAEIVVFERGEYVSWANCGIPYYVGDVVEEREQLTVKTPEQIGRRFDLDVRTMNEVVDIDPESRKIVVEDKGDGENYRESYDKLVLSPGAEPMVPPIDGVVEVENLFTAWSIPDAESIKEEAQEAERALIIGGGFIGLEMAENFHELGLEVTLVEMMDQVLPPLDYEMAAMIQNHLRNKGIDLRLGDEVVKFEQDGERIKSELQSGEIVGADLVLVSAGIEPNTDLAEKAGLEIGETGAIRVDEYLETSDSNIYAIGDAIEVKNCVTDDYQHLPLAGPANEQGRIVANNIAGSRERYDCSLGTFIVKAFDLTAACTGVKEDTLRECDISYEKSYTFSKSHASYYPDPRPMWIKLMFDPDSGEIYGSQIVGRGGVDKRIDVIDSNIRFGGDVFDLQKLDLAYAPPYSSAKDPVNMAGYVAGNVVEGVMDVVHWDELGSLDEDETVILDVRSEGERENEHIEGSKHIPVDQLRDRLDELPKDKKIVTHCAVGLRSYIATRILVQNGYDASNLSGGYGIYNAVQRDKGEEVSPIISSIE